MSNTATTYRKRGFVQNISAAPISFGDTDNLSHEERFMLAQGFWPVTTPDSTVKRWEHPETGVTVQAANVADYIAQVKAERERERRKKKAGKS